MKTLYTVRLYPCGCNAEGSGNVPAYCRRHPVDHLAPEQEKNQAPEGRTGWEKERQAK